MGRGSLRIVIAVLAAAAAGIAVFGGLSTAIFVVAGLIALFALLWDHLEWGLYVIAALYPFTYFQFIYGEINVQYVDIVAMCVALVWGVRALYGVSTGEMRIHRSWFPAAVPMALFIIASAASVANVDRELLGISVKYLLRPIAFFYLMYVMLMQVLITRERILTVTLHIMYWVGIFISGMGLWSLVFPPLQGTFRAMPVPVFGFELLGPNHNLIAEALLMTIPFGYALFVLERRPVEKNIYLFGTIGMCLITLLTLSRSGWLGLVVEAALLVALQYRRHIGEFARSFGAYLAALLILPAVALFVQFLGSSTVISSNLNRLKLLNIAADLFREHPVLGAGPGTFPHIVSQIRWYVIEYGGALDAHGMYAKILAEQGILGTVTWTLLLGVILVRLYRAYAVTRGTRWGVITAAGLIATIGGITFQLFGTGYYLSKFWFPIGVALAAAHLALDALHQYGKKTA